MRWLLLRIAGVLHAIAFLAGLLALYDLWTLLVVIWETGEMWPGPILGSIAIALIPFCIAQAFHRMIEADIQADQRRREVERR